MSRKAQSGFAMVIVIWVMSLMTIMAGSFALTMRRETAVVSAVKDNAVVLATAETGIAIAQQMLSLVDKNKRWRADGSVYQLYYQDAEVRVRVLSEQGKIDINKADEVLLTAMMSSTSIEMEKQQELVSAILDWHDEDELVHINGAEKQEYEDAGLSYQPANKDFQIIDELQMVLGMNVDIYQQLQPLITVYSEQSQVDLQVASKEVLQAIAAIDPALLDDYLQQRIESYRAGLPAPVFPQMNNEDENNNYNSNEVYTVISQARFLGEVDSGVKVIIKKTADESQGNYFEVLDWQKIYQELSLFSDEVEQLLVTEQDESE